MYRKVECNELRNPFLYPELVKHLRQKNMCYLPTESDKTQQRNQGDDFMLEQRIKRLKMIAPKGKASEKT